MTYTPSIAERIAWTSGQLSSAEVKVLAALASCGDWHTGQRCHPSVETLVARSGVSRATVTRTLARLRNWLQPGGPWIVVKAWRRRHATTYDLCLERLATQPPKEQQTVLTPFLDTPALEAQNEPPNKLEAQNEPQGPELEAQNEPSISLSGSDLSVHTQDARARENAPKIPEPELPLLGRLAPRPCAHPHTHAWCEGRVHVPRDLHFELLDRLGTRPGESLTAKAGRLVAFYADTMAHLAPEATIANAYTFWKAAYAEWIARTEARATPARQSEAPADVWTQILDRLATKVSRRTFGTWFAETVLVADRGAVIEVASVDASLAQLASTWIPKHYGAVVDAAIAEVRPGTRVAFLVIDAQQRKSG